MIIAKKHDLIFILEACANYIATTKEKRIKLKNLEKETNNNLVSLLEFIINHPEKIQCNFDLLRKQQCFTLK